MTRYFRFLFGLSVIMAALFFLAYFSGVMFYGIRDNNWPVHKNALTQKSDNLSLWAINRIEKSLEEAFVDRNHAYIPIKVFGQPEDYSKTVLELFNSYEEKYQVRIINYKFATGATEDGEKIFRGIWIIHQSNK